MLTGYFTYATTSATIIDMQFRYFALPAFSLGYWYERSCFSLLAFPSIGNINSRFHGRSTFGQLAKYISWHNIYYASAEYDDYFEWQWFTVILLSRPMLYYALLPPLMLNACNVSLPNFCLFTLITRRQAFRHISRRASYWQLLA